MNVICCICNKENTNYTTSCNHTFCRNCIYRWMKIKNNCPICRAKLIYDVDFIKDNLNIVINRFQKDKSLFLKQMLYLVKTNNNFYIITEMLDKLGINEYTLFIDNKSYTFTV